MTDTDRRMLQQEDEAQPVEKLSKYPFGELLRERAAAAEGSTKIAALEAEIKTLYDLVDALLNRIRAHRDA